MFGGSGERKSSSSTLSASLSAHCMLSSVTSIGARFERSDSKLRSARNATLRSARGSRGSASRVSGMRTRKSEGNSRVSSSMCGGKSVATALASCSVR